MARLWEIFDQPCGQRLEPMLKTEIGRLRRLGELICSDETKNKLKTIAISTVDKKLEHEKEVLEAKKEIREKFQSAALPNGAGQDGFGDESNRSGAMFRLIA